MDAVLTAHQQFCSTPNFITDEFVCLANTCRLWLHVIYLNDIASEDNKLNMAYYNGDCQNESHSFPMPYQEKPPQWVWKVWQEVLRKSCLRRCHHINTWIISPPTDPILPRDNAGARAPLTPPSDSSLSLKDMVATLPQQYKALLGEFTLQV